ncbi:NADH dehydrogenase, FAD-containing subunit [Erythrobacter litoralis]|uniref:FAD-dependent oxidoreductase n=1 Tax=Erythrobacter litoralis TaxID=39960 RepID=UPI00054D137A|nr:FAD-dependent oxidoreductase [Erythrobacter litoralis]AOL22826.1 NADH dehydrogenase, FAD-containing subunit [Erythrobacter litoralis]
MRPPSKHLLLVGGGHAHVAVLADWIENGPPPGARATLLTPHPALRYSGMVPGWMVGDHERLRGIVDCAGLAGRAGVELVLARASAIDPDARAITTDAGERIGFDLASLDVGGTGHAAATLGEDPRLIEIRPIERFVERLAQWRAELLAADPAPFVRAAVIGGGAGGVELAFAMRNLAGLETRPEVTLVAGSAGLVPTMSRAVRRKVASELARQEIAVVAQDARFGEGTLRAGKIALEPFDIVLAALGSAAPDWPSEGGLATDPAGFIAVDAFQRSISHPHVFAVGDVAARQDREVPHSGVHAVFAGPKLAANLRAALADRAVSERYRPRFNSLYLLSTGNGAAIASYGPLAARGRWVAMLKRWIDLRWIDTYAGLAGSA